MGAFENVAEYVKFWDGLLDETADFWYAKAQEGLVATESDSYDPDHLKRFLFHKNDDRTIQVDVSLMDTPFQEKKMLLLGKDDGGERITTIVEACGANIARFARM